jgi:hypothetical protein
MRRASVKTLKKPATLIVAAKAQPPSSGKKLMGD